MRTIGHMINISHPDKLRRLLERQAYTQLAPLIQRKLESMVDINFNEMTMEFGVVENMMDAETKAVILSKASNCSEQELLDAYLLLHKEKFGKEFLQS